MGYVQNTTGITTVAAGTPVAFATPICPQISLQVTGTGTAVVEVDISVDGTNFTAVSVSGGNIKSTAPGSISPIAAMRYNVTSISGSVNVSIAAAVPGTN